MKHRRTDRGSCFPLRRCLRSGSIAAAALLAFIPIYVHSENQVSVKADIAEHPTELPDSPAIPDTNNDPVPTQIPETQTEGSANADPSVPTETFDTESDPYDYSKPVPQNDPVDIHFFDDAVIIGNSRAEGLVFFNDMTGTTSFTHKGLTVSSAFTEPIVDAGEEELSAIDALRRTEFSKVYLLFGSNELGWWSDQVFINRYQTLINELKAINPTADIYVHAIIPFSARVNANSEFLKNKRVQAYNQQILAMAKANGLYYLDVSEIFAQKDGALPDDAATDGIHLKKKYCQQWLDYLLCHTAE